MPVQFADTRQRSLENHKAMQKVRLRDTDTGEFLHLSGQGTTRNVHESWLGFKHQALTLAIRAFERGEEFPFSPVHKKFFDRVAEVNQ